MSPFFTPRSQLGVGIKGGLEVAIHTSRYLLELHQDDDSMCLMKLDFRNAFNECDRKTMLDQVLTHFPELFRWSQWSYSCASELHFGRLRILSSTGVRQGDPLGPLLFCLTLDKLLQETDAPSLASTGSHSFWYLDDGTLIGPRAHIIELYNQILSRGPTFGLHLNPSKCELYWPTGDNSFPEFPANIIRLQDGVSLLGTPLWGL